MDMFQSNFKRANSRPRDGKTLEPSKSRTEDRRGVDGPLRSQSKGLDGQASFGSVATIGLGESIRRLRSQASAGDGKHDHQHLYDLKGRKTVCPRLHKEKLNENVTTILLLDGRKKETDEDEMRCRRISRKEHIVSVDYPERSGCRSFVFRFDNVLDSSTSTASEESLWETVGNRFLDKAQSGVSSVLFTVGQFRTEERSWVLGSAPNGGRVGLVARTGRELLLRRGRMSQQQSSGMNVALSVCMIWEDQIKDLLRFTCPNDKRSSAQTPTGSLGAAESSLSNLCELAPACNLEGHIWGLSMCKVADSVSLDQLLEAAMIQHAMTHVHTNLENVWCSVVFIFHVHVEASSAYATITFVDRRSPTTWQGTSLREETNSSYGIAPQSPVYLEPPECDFTGIEKSFFRRSLDGHCNVILLGAASVEEESLTESLGVMRAVDRMAQQEALGSEKDHFKSDITNSLKSTIFEINRQVTSKDSLMTYVGDATKVGAQNRQQEELLSQLEAGLRQLKNPLPEHDDWKVHWYKWLAKNGLHANSCDLVSELDSLLINVHFDPTVHRKLVFPLKAGESSLGRSPAQDIDYCLDSIEVQSKHCLLLRETDGGEVSIKNISDHFLRSNGEACTADSIVSLRHLDRIAFSSRHIFLYESWDTLQDIGSLDSAQIKTARQLYRESLEECQKDRIEAILSATEIKVEGTKWLCLQHIITQDELNALCSYLGLEYHFTLHRFRNLRHSDGGEYSRDSSERSPPEAVSHLVSELAYCVAETATGAEFLKSPSLITAVLLELRRLARERTRDQSHSSRDKAKSGYAQSDTAPQLISKLLGKKEYVLGKAAIFLESLRYGIPVQEEVPVVGLNGQVRGWLSVRVEVHEDQHSSLVQGLHDGDSFLLDRLLGTLLSFRVQLRQYSEVDCHHHDYIVVRYEFYSPLDAHQTSPQPALRRVKFNHETVIRDVQVTANFLDYIICGHLEMKILGGASEAKAQNGSPSSVQLRRQCCVERDSLSSIGETGLSSCMLEGQASGSLSLSSEEQMRLIYYVEDLERRIRIDQAIWEDHEESWQLERNGLLAELQARREEVHTLATAVEQKDEEIQNAARAAKERDERHVTSYNLGRRVTRVLMPSRRNNNDS